MTSEDEKTILDDRKKRSSLPALISAAVIGALVSAVCGGVSSYMLIVREMGDFATHEQVDKSIERAIDTGPWSQDRGAILTRIDAVERSDAKLETQMSTAQTEIKDDLRVIRDAITKLTIEVAILQKKIDKNS